MIHGESEGKHRAVSQLARDANASLLCSNDCFGDGQAHASAADEVSLIFSPVKFVEDHGLLKIVDAWAAVGHASRHAVARKLSGNGDGPILWRIDVGVVNKLYERLFGTLEISAHWRKPIAYTDADVASAQGAFAVRQRGINDLLDRRWSQ